MNRSDGCWTRPSEYEIELVLKKGHTVIGEAEDAHDRRRRLQTSAPQMSLADFKAALKRHGFRVVRTKIEDGTGKCPGVRPTGAMARSQSCWRWAFSLSATPSRPAIMFWQVRAPAPWRGPTTLGRNARRRAVMALTLTLSDDPQGFRF
jgi:hypothetical protein